MKRLQLAAFKTKKATQDQALQLDQLLGQVLGHCQDGSQGKQGGVGDGGWGDDGIGNGDWGNSGSGIGNGDWNDDD